MRLIVTNPALKEAFERQGKDWTTSRARNAYCCLRELSALSITSKAMAKVSHLPVEKGTKVEEIISLL